MYYHTSLESFTGLILAMITAFFPLYLLSYNDVFARKFGVIEYNNA